MVVDIVLDVSENSHSNVYSEVLSKVVSVTVIFQRIQLQVLNSDIEKCILMAACDENFILEIFLNGCFPKTAAKIYLS